MAISWFLLQEYLAGWNWQIEKLQVPEVAPLMRIWVEPQPSLMCGRRTSPAARCLHQRPQWPEEIFFCYFFRRGNLTGAKIYDLEGGRFGMWKDFMHMRWVAPQLSPRCGWWTSPSAGYLHHRQGSYTQNCLILSLSKVDQVSCSSFFSNKLFHGPKPNHQG